MKTAEQEAVLRSVKKLIEFWHIQPEELVDHTPGGPCVAPEPPPQALPKYKHPMTGETWNGEGSQPQWLREALTRGGYTVDELRHPPPQELG